MGEDELASGSALRPHWVPTRSGARRGGRQREFSPVPMPRARLEVPAGLSSAGETALRTAIDRVAASKSENTLRGYAADWSIWCHAAHQLGLTPVPAEPAGLAAFVSWLRDERGCTPATIRRRLAGVAWVHRLAGQPIDTRHALVAGAVTGVAQEAAPQRQAAALVLGELRQMLGHAGTGVAGTRNRALLLLGWAGALRRSELVALRADVPRPGETPWSHVQHTDEGLMVRLVRTKGERERPAEVGIPRGKAPETCPVRAVETWVREGEVRYGPLFRPVSMRGVLEPRPLSGEAVRKVVREIAAKAGVLGTALEPVSAHSLRAGFITEAYKRGLDDESIMGHSRHKDLRTMRRYVRRAKLVTSSVAGKVGL